MNKLFIALLMAFSVTALSAAPGVGLLCGTARAASGTMPDNSDDPGGYGDDSGGNGGPDDTSDDGGCGGGSDSGSGPDGSGGGTDF